MVAGLITAIPVVVAAPQRLFIELDVIFIDTIEEARPQSAIANRQRFGLPLPGIGWLDIPKHPGGSRLLRHTGKRGQQIHGAGNRQHRQTERLGVDHGKGSDGWERRGCGSEGLRV